MAIKGSLREAALPDVIQLLFLGRRTGCLAVADRQSHASVYFEDGWVIHATIVNRRDRLGDMLVKSGRVTPQHLDQAIQMQRLAQGRKVGAILVELGALTEEEVTRAVHRQVEEAVFTLFTWTGGSFSFEPGVLPDPDVDRVRIAPDALLLEGARRVDEWSLIEKKIPSFDLVFALDPGSTAPGLDYSPEQQRLLPLLDGARDVRALIDETGQTDYEVCQALYGLIAAGLVHRVGTTTAAPAGRSLDLQIDEHRNLGIAFYRTGMLEEAEREFRRVAQLRPSEGQAPFFLGLIAARQGRWSEAASLFRHAVDRAGPRGPILHNLGVALAQAGEPDQAESRLADAAGRAPNDARLHLAWGLAALERGDPALAVVRLTRARELAVDRAPAPLWYWGAARAHALAGDLETAVRVAGDGAERYPEDAVLLNNHAVFLEASGDLAAAEAVLHRALAESPSLPQVSKNLGDVYYRLGRFDDAWDAFQRAVRLRPDLGDDLHFKLGNLALKRGDPEAARGHWGRAIELNPRHQLARANLQTLSQAG